MVEGESLLILKLHKQLYGELLMISIYLRSASYIQPVQFAFVSGFWVIKINLIKIYLPTKHVSAAMENK